MGLINNPWFRNYALPCEDFPNMEEILIHLNPNSTLKEIRNYFFSIHNIMTFGMKEYDHLVIPYLIVSYVDGDATAKLHKPFFTLPPDYHERIFPEEFILKSNEMLHGSPLERMFEGGIIITHAGVIVDYAKELDMSKFNIYKS